MMENTGKAEQTAVSDEGKELLQVEAATKKRKWYRESSVLVATFALVVSVCTFVIGQVNVVSDRQIQDRYQLTALISQLSDALARAQNDPSSPSDLVLLTAGSAAELIDKLDPDASTATEKIQVAGALVLGSDLPRAMPLLTAAERQSTNMREKISAIHLIAHINFQIGNSKSGRDEYMRMIKLLQAPQNELDSSLIRDALTTQVELWWAGDEFSFVKSCQDATEHLRNAKQILDRIPAHIVVGYRTNLDNAVKIVGVGCPAVS